MSLIFNYQNRKCKCYFFKIFLYIPPSQIKINVNSVGGHFYSKIKGKVSFANKCMNW